LNKIIIMYNNNSEYRDVFRNYFKMDTTPLEQKYEEWKESDPITYDELMYDEEAVKKGMKHIYETTKTNDKFCELYCKAAGRFLSEDLEIGLCVLLTYDYFSDFILLYENPTDSDLYETLYSKL